MVNCGYFIDQHVLVENANGIESEIDYVNINMPRDPVFAVNCSFREKENPLAKQIFFILNLPDLKKKDFFNILINVRVLWLYSFLLLLMVNRNDVKAPGTHPQAPPPLLDPISRCRMLTTPVALSLDTHLINKNNLCVALVLHFKSCPFIFHIAGSYAALCILLNVSIPRFSLYLCANRSVCVLLARVIM